MIFPHDFFNGLFQILFSDQFFVLLSDYYWRSSQRSLTSYVSLTDCCCYFVNSTVKTEKKTVQFSEDIQVETIEPEQEPVYIDEVRSLV